MKITASSICDIGKRRLCNQDAVLVYQDEVHDFALFLVADGMGGHADGEKASGAIAAGIRSWLSQIQIAKYSNNIAALLRTVSDKMIEINDFILETWNQQQTCGSTCVLLLLLGEFYGVFAVGDSRIYLSRGLRCAPITKDDVWENQHGIADKYAGCDLSQHRHYGKLLHSVGSERPLAYSVLTERLQRGDVFALCSDGVYKMCTPQFLERKIRSCRWRDLNTIKKDIMRQVYHNGAEDNASLILVKCQ